MGIENLIRPQIVIICSDVRPSHYALCFLLWPLYLLTFGLFGLGILYDFWTLNTQISERNYAKTGIRR